jgi:hypothetical protein
VGTPVATPHPTRERTRWDSRRRSWENVHQRRYRRMWRGVVGSGKELEMRGGTLRCTAGSGLCESILFLPLPTFTNGLRTASYGQFEKPWRYR